MSGSFRAFSNRAFSGPQKRKRTSKYRPGSLNFNPTEITLYVVVLKGFGGSAFSPKRDCPEVHSMRRHPPITLIPCCVFLNCKN